MTDTSSPFDTNRVGDWAEVVACAWLMRRGYDVYRNASCVGPVDLVALKDSATVWIDVKMVKIEANPGKMPGMPTLSPRQVSLGVRLLYVSDGGNCAFSREELVDAELVRRGMQDPRPTQYRPMRAKPCKKPTMTSEYGKYEMPDWFIEGMKKRASR